MATIVERRRKDGTVAYLAQIIKRSHNFQESRSFTTRKAAEAWAKKREKEIASAVDVNRHAMLTPFRRPILTPFEPADQGRIGSRLFGIRGQKLIDVRHGF